MTAEVFFASSLFIFQSPIKKQLLDCHSQLCQIHFPEKAGNFFHTQKIISLAFAIDIGFI